MGGDLGYLGCLRGLEVLGISCGPGSQDGPENLGGPCLEGLGADLVVLEVWVTLSRN